MVTRGVRHDHEVTRSEPHDGYRGTGDTVPPTGHARVTKASLTAGRASAEAGRKVAHRVKRAADADGAGESGMSALLGAQALSSAGDALIIVALASTVFFDVPLGEARGKVALYLLLTLMPFALLVPVAGPLLDRFRHGRRTVLAASALVRALVAWSLATSLTGLGLFPQALAVLVLSRAYGVARSAALPRVRPPGLTLVAANARINVASVTATGVAAGIGGAVSATLGPGWVLRLAAPVLVAAALVAFRLPAQIDEDRVYDRGRAPRFRLLEAGSAIVSPLVAAVALRGLAGFLTIFLAFLLREQDASTQVVGIVVGAVVAGQLLGTGLASRLPPRLTRRLTVLALGLPAVGCVVAAVLGGPMWAAMAAGLTGVSYALSKFTLDASLQTNVPPVSTSGAFSRSETGMQLAFALGGALAIALPSRAGLGFAIAAVLPLLGVLAGTRARRGRSLLPGRRRASRQPRRSGAGAADQAAAPQTVVGPESTTDPDRPWWVD